MWAVGGEGIEECIIIVKEESDQDVLQVPNQPDPRLFRQCSFEDLADWRFRAGVE